MNVENKTNKVKKIEESGNSGDVPSSRPHGGFMGWFKGFFSLDHSLKDELEDVVDELKYEASLYGDNEASFFGEEERSIIKNTLTFRNKRVDDIMVPRTDIIAVEASSSFDEVLEMFVEGTTSRIPVYRDTLDEVIAMVHIKDVFRTLVTTKEGDKNRQLSAIQRPILFVPPSMKLFGLLTKMQTTHIHMALVVDEYGGTDGLLTIEDLVEQIVGDIEDEHDEAEADLLRELPGGDLITDARLPIEELEDLLGLDLLPDDQDDDVDTLGGLVFTIAGYIPKVGEIITDKNGLRYTIIEGDARHIRTVRICRNTTDIEEPAEDNETVNP